MPISGEATAQATLICQCTFSPPYVRICFHKEGRTACSLRPLAERFSSFFRARAAFRMFSMRVRVNDRKVLMWRNSRGNTFWTGAKKRDEMKPASRRSATLFGSADTKQRNQR